MPTVTVIIPTFNRRHMLREALSSVLEQSYSDYSILVIDDGSTDGTDHDCLELNNQIRYHWQTNRGEASARNQGIRLATTAYVAFLDSDDQWDPHFLEAAMQIIQENPSLALVSTGCVEFPGNTMRPKRLPPRLSGNLFVQLFSRNIITASAVVVTRSCFDSVGLFDERLEQATDYDMWLRIAQTFPIAFINQPLCRWRRHAGNVSAQEIQHRIAVLNVVESYRTDSRISAGLYCARRSRLLVSLGKAYLRDGQASEAHRCFREAMTLTPCRARPLLYFLSTWIKDWCMFSGTRSC